MTKRKASKIGLQLLKPENKEKSADILLLDADTRIFNIQSEFLFLATGIYIKLRSFNSL